ncbi:MAG: molecular chaperone TorD family protein [Planctomycetes bacterium]|nr:molecular chaperone TorD family protein [Planctomycetota bacterium]
MNARRQQRFDAIARLFRYPGDEYAADARTLAERLAAEHSVAAEPMLEFVTYTENASLSELEETYTRTFDLNPSCSPEIGWHLFGEEYVRGLFMVRMRNEMRERGLEETGELPDHLVHVLAVLAVMEEAPARELARACLCPAIGKMLSSIDKQQAKEQAAEQPFRPLVAALAELILEEFDLPSTALAAKEEDLHPLPNGVDPLHGMPCSGCSGPEFVPLNARSAAQVQHEETHP